MGTDPLATTNPPVEVPASQALDGQGAAFQRPPTYAEAEAIFNSMDSEDVPPEVMRVIRAGVGPVTTQNLTAGVIPPAPPVDYDTPVSLAPAPEPAAPAGEIQAAPPVPQIPVAPVPVVLTKAQQLAQMVAAGVDENAAAMALYGAVLQPQGQGQAPPPVSQEPITPPAQAELQRVDAELEAALTALETDPNLQYGDAETNKQQAKITRLTRERQDKLLAADREANELWTQEFQRVEQAKANSEQAEWTTLVNRFPALKSEDTAFYRAFVATYEGLAATPEGQAILATPNFRTTLVNVTAAGNPALVAQQPNAVPGRIPVPPAQPVTQYAPGAVPGVPPTAPARAMTTDELEALSERDPAAYAQIRSRVTQDILRRR